MSLSGVSYEMDRNFSVDAKGVKRSDCKVIGFQMKSARWFHSQVQKEKKQRVEGEFDKFRGEFKGEVFYINEDAVLGGEGILVIPTQPVNSSQEIS